METKHTPTPWRVATYKEGFPPSYIIADACKAKLPYICMVGGHYSQEDIKQANAEFIVRACNSHDALLAACKEAFEHATHDPLARLDQPQLTQLAKVIAQAEPKEKPHDPR